ncbi:MAG: helix-turn-helix transcriptional regulator [Oscillospiraceae bacterium]|nr:helix-turn-helix transcriptional regulator [Oscillospiraceae bacterium]
MAEFVNLERFHAKARHYHIYRIRSTYLDHQPHYHNYYQICFVVSGELQHIQQRETVRLTAGNAFIVPPGFIHALHFENTRSEVYSLAFEWDLFGPGFSQSEAGRFLTGLHAKDPRHIGMRLRTVLDNPQRQHLQNILDCLIWQQQEKIPDFVSAAPNLVASALQLLIQSYYSQPQNAPHTPTARDTGTVEQCLEYIDAHFREALSLNELCKQFGMSRSVFCAAFPQLSGLPLRQYIAQKRIAEAQMLIRSQKQLSLSEVATSVGYQDDTTFYRNFLKIAGVTPSQYRCLWEDQ